MTSESQRRASATYHKKLRESGKRKVQVWLDAPARHNLELLKKKHGSNEAAITAALALASKLTLPAA